MSIIREEVLAYIKKIEDAFQIEAFDIAFDNALFALAAKRFVSIPSDVEDLKEQFIYNADYFRDYVVTFAKEKFDKVNEDDFPTLLGSIMEAVDE